MQRRRGRLGSGGTPKPLLPFGLGVLDHRIQATLFVDGDLALRSAGPIAGAGPLPSTPKLRRAALGCGTLSHLAVE
jgi:hypothetical protein